MRESYDVVVVGGGPGGTMAAVGAASRGASVLVVERYGFLGGMATAGLVNPFMWYFHEGKPLTTAAFNGLLDRLDRAGGLARDRQTFDDELMKVALDGLMADNGVDVALHSWFTGLDRAGNTVKAVHIMTKSGSATVGAKVFVDSTGDGDLAAAAGATVELGRPADGACQPMTLCFRLAGIENPEGWDAGWDPMREEMNAIYQEARRRGEVGNPREDVLIFRTTVPGVVHFNTTRIVGKSAVDSRALAEAEAEGRRQVVELLTLLRAKSKRCRNAWLVKMAPQIGIRESRRVMGTYVLTIDDVLGAAKFDDGIARSNYPVDIHNPAGTGTVIRNVPKGDYYEVPYRCLVPRGVDNLLVGSRCISATHEAHSSMRVMPVVAGIGEAAGIAAARSAKSGTPPASVDGAALKRELFG